MESAESPTTGSHSRRRLNRLAADGGGSSAHGREGGQRSSTYPPGLSPSRRARQAYRLAYRSQREAPHDRALRRAFKLRGKLGADGGIGDYVPKPKWMRWRTYDRKLEKIFATEEVVDAHLSAFVQKLGHRLKR